MDEQDKKVGIFTFYRSQLGVPSYQISRLSVFYFKHILCTGVVLNQLVYKDNIAIYFPELGPTKHYICHLSSLFSQDFLSRYNNHYNALK